VPVTSVAGANGRLPEDFLTALHRVSIAFPPPVEGLLPAAEPARFWLQYQVQAVPGQPLKVFPG